jgi:prephenate dehydrogenase
VPHLGIVGTGMMGASVGLAAAARGWEVTGWDVDPAASEGARRAGAIDRVAEHDEVYARSDVVVIAAHTAATIEEVRGLRSRALPRAQLVIDIASVKAAVAAAGASVSCFVATHPMAGSERRGPGAARADLFDGRTWCYVPTGDEMHTARARDFIAGFGARPVAVDAEEHDKIVALTSHLPQLIAYAFTQSVSERSQIDPELVDALCGPAARELMRLGRSSPLMWDEIFAANRSALDSEFERFSKAIRDRGSLGEPGSRSVAFSPRTPAPRRR